MFSRFLLFFGAAGAGLCAAANGRREFGARTPAKPCSSVSLAPSPRDFSANGRRRLGARFPAKPCSFVSFAPSPGAFSATGRFHPIKTPSRKRRVLIFSCYSLPRPLPRPATRRSTSVSFISSDTIMPSISSSFSTSSSGKRFRIRWQTMFM